MDPVGGINNLFVNGVAFSMGGAAGGDQRRRGSDPRRVSAPERGGAARDAQTDAAGLKLTPEQQKQVLELKQRDQEVRTHEQAHVGASGGVSVSGPTYSYQQGPDGKQYAIGGEVQIDTSEESDPHASLIKARQIQAAANAPANPSAQDKAVAAEGAAMAAKAQREITEKSRAERAGGSGATPAGVDGRGGADGSSLRAAQGPAMPKIDPFFAPDRADALTRSEAARAYRQPVAQPPALLGLAFSKSV